LKRGKAQSLDAFKAPQQPRRVDPDAPKSSEEAIMKMLEMMDMMNRCKKAREDQDRLGNKLEGVLRRTRSTGMMSPSSGLASPGRSCDPSRTHEAKGWSKPPMFQPGNPLQAQMSYDKMMRYRDETSMYNPTVRQLCRVDDTIDPKMQVTYQDVTAGTLRVELFEPLVGREVNRECAKEQVLLCLPPELQEHVGVCLPIKRGAAMEVRLTDAEHIKAIEKLLSVGLGKATRLKETGVDRDKVLAAVMFDMSKMDNRRGAEEEMAFEKEVPKEQAKAKKTKEEKKKKKKQSSTLRSSGTLNAPGDTGAGVWEAGDDEAGSSEDGNPEMEREKLNNAIAKWDAKLAQSRGFWEAARRIGPRLAPL